jgi:pseudaminic acid cytidylyltransferase
MNNVAIIIARGGSKRIPKKNVKDFLGKPIIIYSIEAAIESELFDEVMVSTDDIEIADIAKKSGASVPFYRSFENSDDFATTSDVLIEVLNKYISLGVRFKYCCCIYPTAPFVTSTKLIKSFELIKTNNAYSVIPICEYSFPILRTFGVENNRVFYHYPEYERTRSQDLPLSYHDCGQFYFLDVEKFLHKKSLVDRESLGLIVPQIECQDIDTLEDWDIAELKFNYIKNKFK